MNATFLSLPLPLPLPSRRRPRWASMGPTGGGRGEVGPNTSAVTYSASVSTDLPFYEPSWAKFDDYLEDRSRIFRAMFPDSSRSERLSDEEWRIKMLPIQFLLVSVYPVVDMRLTCRSKDKNHLSGVPPTVKRVIELQATRWELQGLDNVHMPPHFELKVQGTLYSDKRAATSRLKGGLEMSITFVLPQILALVPENIRKSVADSILERLLQRMKEEVDVSLLADFRKFGKEKREKQRKEGALPATTAVHSLKTDSL